MHEKVLKLHRVFQDCKHFGQFEENEDLRAYQSFENINLSLNQPEEGSFLQPEEPCHQWEQERLSLLFCKLYQRQVDRKLRTRSNSCYLIETWNTLLWWLIIRRTVIKNANAKVINGLLGLSPNSCAASQQSSQRQPGCKCRTKQGPGSVVRWCPVLR